jgi:hypothetical protein
VLAGGAISVAAITGLGGLQKVFGEKDSGQHTEFGDNSDIARLIQKVDQLSKQLGNLQGKFADVISGKMNVPEMVVNKLTTTDASFAKIDVPEGGFLKINGDASFIKLDAGESTFQKMTVPEGGFLKLDGQSAFNGDATFLKLDVPDTGFMKINGDASFIKLDATDIVAQKIVAGSITTGNPTTTTG